MIVLFKRHCKFILLSSKISDIVEIVCVCVCVVCKEFVTYLYMDGYEELLSMSL